MQIIEKTFRDIVPKELLNIGDGFKLSQALATSAPLRWENYLQPGHGFGRVKKYDKSKGEFVHYVATDEAIDKLKKFNQRIFLAKVDFLFQNRISEIQKKLDNSIDPARLIEIELQQCQSTFTRYQGIYDDIVTKAEIPYFLTTNTDICPDAIERNHISVFVAKKIETWLASKIWNGPPKRTQTTYEKMIPESLKGVSIHFQFNHDLAYLKPIKWPEYLVKFKSIGNDRFESRVSIFGQKYICEFGKTDLIKLENFQKLIFALKVDYFENGLLKNARDKYERILRKNQRAINRYFEKELEECENILEHYKDIFDQVVINCQIPYHLTTSTQIGIHADGPAIKVLAYNFYSDWLRSKMDDYNKTGKFSFDKKSNLALANHPGKDPQLDQDEPVSQKQQTLEDLFHDPKDLPQCKQALKETEPPILDAQGRLIGAQYALGAWARACQKMGYMKKVKWETVIEVFRSEWPNVGEGVRKYNRAPADLIDDLELLIPNRR